MGSEMCIRDSLIPDCSPPAPDNRNPAQCDPRGAFLYNRERSFLLYKIKTALSPRIGQKRLSFRQVFFPCYLLLFSVISCYFPFSSVFSVLLPGFALPAICLKARPAYFLSAGRGSFPLLLLPQLLRIISRILQSLDGIHHHRLILFIGNTVPLVGAL